jgi:hypothetical protein
MDLADFLKEHAGRLERMPVGAFAVMHADDLVEEEQVEPGVIFCLRCESTKGAPDTAYALSPYYLVYVTESGEIRLNYTHAKRTLDMLKKLSLGRTDPDEEALARFSSLTKDFRDMEAYQRLLAKAVAAITGREEERGVESLFQRGGTVISPDSFRGVEDFEVVSYLIILGSGGGADD